MTTIFEVAAKGLPGVVEPFLVRCLAAHVFGKLAGKKREVRRVELKCFGELFNEVRPGRAAPVVFDVVEILRGNRHAVIAFHARREFFLTESELFSLIEDCAAERALWCDKVAPECRSQVCGLA